MMKNILKILYVIIVLNILFTSSAFSADIPADLTNEVNSAITNGKLLFNSYSNGPVKDTELLKKINIQKSKINDFCEFEYLPYVVTSNNKEIIYLIAQGPKENQIVFGKHFKIFDDKIVSSTKSCFVLPSPPENSVGSFVTHLLSDTPTEFHVFISLKHNKPVFVGTARGIWKVENGEIEFIEERK